MQSLAVVDAHVHFWDPGALRYPWLATVPPLARPFAPEHLTDASIERLVFVEANPHPYDAPREVERVQAMARADARIAGIVAFADLLDARRLDATLDALAGTPLVKGVRHNIQGHAAGFCLQDAFVDGVRQVGARHLTFDLCATHDQLGDVTELVRRCPDTRFVLDHCGKPSVRDGRFAAWAAHVTALAACDNVWCKLSGLLTEADDATRGDASLLPYAEHVLARFGAERVMFGSDWPVMTLAGSYDGWLAFTRRCTASLSDDERHAFYHDNAARFYGL